MSATQLGQACTLLFGYRPAWNPNGPDNAPFFAPPTPSTVTHSPDYVPPEWPEWSDTPYITIHESAESLLSAVYKYNVAPAAHDPAGIHVPVGPLVLGDADRPTALGAEHDFLGVDLSASHSYMLVTFERVDGTARHPFVSNPAADASTHLTDAAKSAIAGLKPAARPDSGSVLYDSKITKADADAYMNQLYNLGTHFVSELTTGDRLIQVFAYDAAHFNVVKNAFKDDSKLQATGEHAVTGHTAAAWEYYTSPVSGEHGEYGFVTSYGSLVALSRDPALAEAIEDGKWSNDFVENDKPSIFAAAKQPELLEPLKQSVVCALTLTPVAELFTDTLAANGWDLNENGPWDRLVKGPWDHFIKGVLLQKYGDAVVIPLTRQIKYDWPRLFPESGDEWTSGIVTPMIDVYQQRLDLARVKLEGEAVLIEEKIPMQSFTSFSQVLQATTDPASPPIKLPSDNITLMAQIIDTSAAQRTPVITMSSKAFGQFNVVCEDMYGALIFEDPTPPHPGRKVALDGFLFETRSAVDPGTGRSRVDLSRVLFDPPPEALVSRVKQSIEFSIITAESLLQSRTAEAKVVRELECAFLTWLASIIPEKTTDIDLATNRARALYLANQLATFSYDAVYVPYLTYESYNKSVNDLCEVARNLTGNINECQRQITNTVNTYKVMDSIAGLNDNVKQIGGALTDYFKVLADGRGAMDGYYASIVKQLDEDLKQTLANIDDLTAELEEQQSVISHGDPPGIMEEFQKAYVEYSEDEVFKAVKSGVIGLFSVGAAMYGIPAAASLGVKKALKQFKKVFDQLQKVMKALKAMKEVAKADRKIGDLNDMSSQISVLGADGALEMPSQADLLEIPGNVHAALADVPEDVPDLNQHKADLQAAVNTLVIIGTALLQAQTKASRLAVQRSNADHLKFINAGQKAKMQGLSDDLHLGDSTRSPEIARIDLIGVTGQLQFQLEQIMLTLAQVLELQDGALQFEYFGEPTAITSFTLQNLLNVIATQDSSIIYGIQKLNPRPQKVPEPITVTIPNVPVGDISGGKVFQFPIETTATEFLTYDMVRIDRVVPNIKGITSTAHGRYEIDLSCQAKPFQDRDYNRETRTFASSLRKFGPYVYDIESGQPKFGTDSGMFDDNVTHLTPFSLWQISLPENGTNRDIQFEGSHVDVSVDFYITAHYDGWGSGHEALALASFDTTLLAAETIRPTLANLEAQMFDKVVLGEWDAVFNVLEGPVNAFLNHQFRAQVSKLDPNNSDNLLPVDGYYCQGVTTRHGFTFTNVTKFTFKLSNPLLQFIPGNNHTVNVIQNLVSGTVFLGTLDVAKGFDPSRCRLVDQDVYFTVDPATSTLTLSMAGVWENNMTVKVTSTGMLPAPLQPDTAYWIVNRADSGSTDSGRRTTLQLAKAAGDSPITLTDAGSGTQTIHPDIEWDEENSPVIVDTSKKQPYIDGTVDLGMIHGKVAGSESEMHTVVLDFSTGAFVGHFEVEPPSWQPGATEISDALKNYYLKHDIKYPIQTIKCTNSQDSRGSALSPKSFRLNTRETTAGNNVLQIFIVTAATDADDVPKDCSILVSEPIPYDPDHPEALSGSNFMVSLMITSKLMFKDVFVGGFNHGDTNIVVEPVAPQDTPEGRTRPWSARIKSGSTTGVVPFRPQYDGGRHRVRFRISGTKKENDNHLTWDLTGMEFKGSREAGVDFRYSNGSAADNTGGTNVDFQYQEYIPFQSDGAGGGLGGEWERHWHDASAMVYINMSGDYPLEIEGLGISQVVKFANADPNVTVDKGSDLQPAVGCKCNDDDMKIAFLSALANSVPGTLKECMQQISFRDISVLALESLLFPANQLITMQKARVPGDLLIVGRFLPVVRKNADKYNVLISAATGAKGVFGGIAFENGVESGSATVDGLPSEFQFEYGPKDENLGQVLTYTINIETGTIKTAGVDSSLIVIVDQPDPDKEPQKVILLPPGYWPGQSGT